MAPIIRECTAVRRELLQVHDHCPEQPYVELEVPQDAKKVLAVSFTTTSRDQGWSDFKEEPSFTWFDASVKRPEGRTNLRTIIIFHNRLANPEFDSRTARWHLNEGPRRRLWIEALRPGDVIQLVPRAVYMAWVNIIQDGQIKIEYEAKEVHDELKGLHLTSNAVHYSRALDISRQEIRLLHVQPGAFEDPIKGYFSRLSLRDAHSESRQFHALSYCWGDPTDRVDISLAPPEDQVEDEAAHQPLSVGRNVADALRRLRQMDQSLVIWIDAVCINQEDLEERARQVTLMTQIYSSASVVHIWLGENNPGVETCFRIIRDICNYNDRRCEGGDGCSCTGTAHSLTLHRMDANVEAHTEGGHKKSFNGMWEIFRLHEKTWTSREIIDLAGGFSATQLSVLMSVLFENPWFARVWVIQEALSSQKALVHCSGELVAWEELLQVNAWLGNAEFRGQSPHIMGQTIMAPIWKSVKPKGRRTGSLTSVVHPEGDGGEELSGILDVFLAGQDLKATDPRDKLFALLAFGDETHVAAELDEFIRPNYDKSVGQVFADFTRWWIRKYGSLSILSSVHCQPTRTWRRTLCSKDGETAFVQPTWAVSSQGRSRWVRANLDAQFDFRATRDTKPDPELLNTSDPLALQLSGYRVSEIVAIGHAPIEHIYPYRHEDQTSVISAVFDKMMDPCGFTPFWASSSVVAQQNQSVAKARGEYMDHVRAHWGYFERSKLRALDPSAVPEIRWYETGSVPTCCDPCFFVAADGRFGLVPWAAKEGDVIVLLDGGNVPFLLRLVKTERDNSERFELVGNTVIRDVFRLV
ncbi:hypothetical protein ACJ41O_010987 [Fusarium nematophilum]